MEVIRSGAANLGLHLYLWNIDFGFKNTNFVIQRITCLEQSVRTLVCTPMIIVDFGKNRRPPPHFDHNPHFSGGNIGLFGRRLEPFIV